MTKEDYETRLRKLLFDQLKMILEKGKQVGFVVLAARTVAKGVPFKRVHLERESKHN